MFSGQAATKSDRGQPSQRQILSGSAGAAIAIVAGQAATGLSFVVLARRLTPGAYGIIAILYAVGLALGGVLDFGSSQLKTRELAKGSGLDSFSSWLARHAAWQAPIVVVAIGVAHISTVGEAKPLVTAALISQGLSYPISSGLTGAVRALRSPALGAWLVAAGNAVLLAAVVMAPSKLLVEWTAVCATSSWVVTALLSSWALKSRMSTYRSKWRGSPWHGGAELGLSGMAVASNGLQVVIVGALAGSVAAGELAAVARWTQPVFLIAAAFTLQTFPSMAAAPSNAAARRILSPVWRVSAAGVLFAVAIAVAAPWLVPAILGPEYTNSIELLQAMILVAILILYGSPLATFLQARGEDRAVALAMTTVSFATLVALALTVRSLGVMAVPVCSGLGSGLLLAIWIRLMSQKLTEPDQT